MKHIAQIPLLLPLLIEHFFDSNGERNNASESAGDSDTKPTHILRRHRLTHPLAR